MQIQQSLGCHHLPISCIWFLWALMDCVSRWDRMSERCSGCHGQERATCVHVFPLCWLLAWCWPAKIKALLSLTGQRNWFWSWCSYISANIGVTARAAKVRWADPSVTKAKEWVSQTHGLEQFLVTVPFSSPTAISNPLLIYIIYHQHCMRHLTVPFTEVRESLCLVL